MDKAAQIAVNIGPGAASNLMSRSTEPEPTDRALVERCQRGEMDAYELLVHRYRQKVFGLAYSMLRNEEDATDVAQEAFIRAWQAIRKFKKNAKFYTWLYRIARNLCVDFVRKRERRPTEPFEEAIDPNVDAGVEAPPSVNPMPAKELERKELRHQIDDALAQLSDDHRAVIQLREFEGLDYAEIARAVGCSIGTVMSRLFYARKQLQKLLKDLR